MLCISMRRLWTEKNKKDVSDLVPNPNSTEFEIDNWEISQLVLKKIVPVVGAHPFPLNELLLMAGTTARFQPKLIFEWGTYIGKAARIFHEVSKELELGAVIHSIDLPDDTEHVEHPHERRGKFVKGLQGVELHQGDGLNTSLQIMKRAKKHAGGRGVLFFVDGDHSYKSVKRELSSIMVNAPQATVLLHDTFYQSADSKYNIGPSKAINDCLKKSKSYKRVDTKTGLPGMTLLYPA